MPKTMIYYNKRNREKLIEAIKDEARDLGIDLVTHDLDQTNIYYVGRYIDLGKLIKAIIGDIRLWFSDSSLNKKEMCISLYNEPWTGESVRIQTRRKR